MVKILILDFIKFNRFISIGGAILATIFHRLKYRKAIKFSFGESVFAIETATSDIYTAASNFSTPEDLWGFGTWKFPTQFSLPDEMLILDVGANIGASTVKFALLFPKATIFAIEPMRRNFELLKRNTEEWGKIECSRCALGANNLAVGISSQSNLGAEWQAQVTTNVDDHSERVEQYTMDRFLEMHDIDFIDFLKINAEGAETEILETFSQWHNKVGILAIAIRSSANFESIGKTMELLLQSRPRVQYVYHLAESRILWSWPRSIQEWE